MNKIKLIEQYKKYLEKEIEKEYIKINFEEGSEIIINMKKLKNDLDAKKGELEEELWTL